MSRVETLERPAKAPARARSRTARARKPAPPQDRLTQRTLFFRRLRKNLRPGLWILGTGAVVLLGVELVRSLPSAPQSVPAAPSAASSALPPPVAAPAPVVQPGLLADALASVGFRITQVVTHGAGATDAAALAQAIGVKDGDPTFGFSLRGIQQRVGALGPVQAVTVERILPGTLVVNITERDVYAIWQTIQNGKVVFELIDKKGNVIADQDAAAAKRRQPSLLLLSGAGAPEQANLLIPELKAQPSVLSHVAAAERVDGLRWNLILKNQTVVKLPAQDEAGALAQLASLQKSMQLLDRPVEAIDLRQAGRMVVRPYDTAPQPADAQKKNKPDRRQEGQ
ncbi:cell division protein FtsQ/DivIB [Acidocella sp.]|uniref:cell division protein FtsQ/DivIB n=1 Tax=Acidocella sp. TaxID=50710 RepID=UPI003D06A55E